MMSCFIVTFFAIAMMAKAQATFVITDVPISTPPEDSIFICGTFNNWRTDSRFVLHKRLDGKYTITMPFDSAFEYKFHRGNWAKVETSKGNRYLSNRAHASGEHGPIYVAIENWQDLGGAKPFDITSLYFFAVAFPSLAAAYFLYKIRNKRKSRIRAAISFLVFLAALLLGRVLMEIVSLPHQYRMGLLGTAAVFAGAPLWYGLLMSTLTKEKLRWSVWIAPSVAGVFLLARLLWPTSLDFLTTKIAGSLSSADELIMLFAMITGTIIYLWMGYNLWKRSVKRDNYTKEEQHLVAALLMVGGFFLITLLMQGIASFTSETMLFWFSRNGLATAGSIFSLTLCYYIFTHDEIFRVTSAVLRKTDNLDSLKALLHQHISEQRLYTNPHLTLQDVADAIQVKPHVLSKVINECHHQNFRDFINRYRIAAFIELARKGGSRRFTFLALALEVGFNSKSTFNAAFKKATNLTPREYFQSLPENVLEDKPLKSAIT